MTSCIPPDSSKKRSATSTSCVGKTPSAARPAARYRTSCSAPAGPSPHSRSANACASAGFARSGSMTVRSSLTALESSALRPGASPFQKGTVGGTPWAFSTRTRPASTRRMRQESLPSRKTSPARLSMAKSSSRCPMSAPSGSAMTWYCAVSGIAPPFCSATRREERRPESMCVSPSRCSLAATARPCRRATPSACIWTTASKSDRSSFR